MERLLRWGLENTPNDGADLPKVTEQMVSGQRPDLNTEVLDAIMGKSDADRMRECMAVIDAPNAEKQDRELAWDDLEMLVEDIDNANNLLPLGLWPAITAHLDDDDDDLQMRCCWVCGTAVQNNPAGQHAFLDTEPLPRLLALLTSQHNSTATRNKAMYCLASTLKHSQRAVDAFGAHNGWQALRNALHDPSQTVRTKTAFLLSSLVLGADSGQRARSLVRGAWRRAGLIDALVDAIDPAHATPSGESGDGPAVDVDFREKAVRVFANVLLREKELRDGDVPEVAHDDKFRVADPASSSAQGVATPRRQEEETSGYEGFERWRLLASDERRRVSDIVRYLDSQDDFTAEDAGFAADEWRDFLAALKA